MQHGVEIRVPWLDLELTRWALRLPDRALVSGRTGKVLPRSLAAAVLPPFIATRPKRGFAVPAGQVAQQTGASGERGFRQSAYLARAAAMLASTPR
jgi:asparagine synthase (glutamine-hydrolysing)